MHLPCPMDSRIGSRISIPSNPGIMRDQQCPERNIALSANFRAPVCFQLCAKVRPPAFEFTIVHPDRADSVLIEMIKDKFHFLPKPRQIGI